MVQDSKPILQCIIPSNWCFFSSGSWTALRFQRKKCAKEHSVQGKPTHQRCSISINSSANIEPRQYQDTGEAVYLKYCKLGSKNLVWPWKSSMSVNMQTDNALTLTWQPWLDLRVFQSTVKLSTLSDEELYSSLYCPQEFPGKSLPRISLDSAHHTALELARLQTLHMELTSEPLASKLVQLARNSLKSLTLACTSSLQTQIHAAPSQGSHKQSWPSILHLEFLELCGFQWNTAHQLMQESCHSMKALKLWWSQSQFPPSFLHLPRWVATYFLSRTCVLCLTLWLLFFVHFANRSGFPQSSKLWIWFCFPLYARVDKLTSLFEPYFSCWSQ